MTTVTRNPIVAYQEWIHEALDALQACLPKPWVVLRQTSDYDGSTYWIVNTRRFFGKRLMLIDDRIEGYNFHVYDPRIRTVAEAVAQDFGIPKVILEY